VSQQHSSEGRNITNVTQINKGTPITLQ